MRSLSLALVLVAVVALPPVSANAAPGACSSLFISEYVEGSSNNKAVEIFNGTGQPVNLAGYALEFYFNGSSTPGASIPLAGTLADQDVYVVADHEAAAAVLAAADQTFTASAFNGDDAVVLKQGSTVLDAIGQVGADPGTAWGSGSTTTQDHTLRRKAAVSAGDANPNDAFDPAVEWDGYPVDTFDGLGSHAALCGDPFGQCDGPATPIHAIQGAGASSPLLGSTVVVEGVVTGDYQDTAAGLAGFFVEELSPDADPATSEGLFLYDNGLGIAVGEAQEVRVRGVVAEHSGLTELTAIDRVVVCRSAVALPATAASLPVSSLSDWEAIEGMRVTIAQPLTVAEVYNLGRYGEVLLAAGGRVYGFTQGNAPSVAGYAGYRSDLARRTILLDDANSQQNRDPILYPLPGLTAANTLRVGDTTAGLTGVVDYRFSAYRLQPVAAAPDFVHANPRPAPLAAPGAVRVVSANVLNYFNGNGQGGGFPTARGASSLSEFNRQRAKTLAMLAALDADVVGLIEIENDAGPAGALADLLAGLNAAAGGSVYAAIDTGVLGTDLIKVALIYKPARVTPVGAWLTDVNAVWSRAPLAQTFATTAGERFTVVVNHLKSKGCEGASGVNLDQGDGQGCYNARRVQQAQRLADWVASTVVPAAGDPDVLLVGDFNAGMREDPLTALVAAGYVNLVDARVGAGAYSYVFDGQSGTLDYALVSAALAALTSGVAEWHANADEPRVLDYNEEFKSAGQLVSLYSPDAFRSSDHDPLVVELSLDGTGGGRKVWLPVVMMSLYPGVNGARIESIELNCVLKGDGSCH